MVQYYILTQDSFTAPAYPAVEYELTKTNGVFDTATPYTGSGPLVDAACECITEKILVLTA